MNIFPKKNAYLMLSDGTIFEGYGIGAKGRTVGEICFNTGLTGYQETITDPSYAEQIINFTFPHIGNVGTNDEDMENKTPFAKGLIIRADITNPSNYRSIKHFGDWLTEHNITGICGVDTRAITRHIREKGAGNCAIYYEDINICSSKNINEMMELIENQPSLEGLDLAKNVTCEKPYKWNSVDDKDDKPVVVAIDYGAKDNILRCLENVGLQVIVVPANTSFEDIMSYNPKGVFLSNGPGDPAATGLYAIPVILQLIETELPIFGICLGFQLLSLALGAKTRKMEKGHRGVNQPVQNLANKSVEITSQNHGFEVLQDTLPDNVLPTHISLFDNSLEGIKVKDKPVFAVQYHPEASPGPHDANYLFDEFRKYI